MKLGNLIERITYYTGIKWIVKKLFGEDCGCEERHKITNADYKILCQLHAKYFNHKYKEPCTCNKENLRNWIKDVDNKLNI